MPIMGHKPAEVMIRNEIANSRTVVVTDGMIWLVQSISDAQHNVADNVFSGAAALLSRRYHLGSASCLVQSHPVCPMSACLHDVGGVMCDDAHSLNPKIIS